MFASEHTQRSPALTDTRALRAAAAIAAGLRKRRTVLLTLTVSTFAIAGALAPLPFASGYAGKFAVETVLRVDASDLSDGERQTAIAEAGAALRRPASLDALVRTLDLGSDDEFSVAEPGAFGVLSDILTGRAMTVAGAEATLRERLSAAVTTAVNPAGDILSVTAASDDPVKSARIAREVAKTYAAELGSAAMRAAHDRAAALEAALQTADAAVFEATAKGGNDNALRRAEEERRSLRADISELEARLVQLSADAESLAASSLDAVLSKPLPASFAQSGIEHMRQMHAEAKLRVEQLSASLGPLHPRFQGAQAALADIRRRIDATLKRLAVSTKEEQATAEKTLADLKARQEALAAAPPSAEAAAFAGLQAKAEQARKDYLEASHRLEAAATAPPVSVRTLRAASPATAVSLGQPLAVLSALGGLAGLFAGWIIAAMAAQYSTQWASRQDGAQALDGQAPMASEGNGGSVADLSIPALPLDIPPQAPAAAEPETVRPARVYRAEARRSLGVAFDQPRPAEDDHPLPAASNTPVADRVRELLMANRIEAEAASRNLPPLVAAGMAGGTLTGPDYARDPETPQAGEEALRQAEAFRRDMASLRMRLAERGLRQAGSRS